jgi:hypothetical protein
MTLLKGGGMNRRDFFLGLGANLAPAKRNPIDPLLHDLYDKEITRLEHSGDWRLITVVREVGTLWARTVLAGFYFEFLRKPDVLELRRQLFVPASLPAGYMRWNDVVSAAPYTAAVVNHPVDDSALAIFAKGLASFGEYKFSETVDLRIYLERSGHFCKTGARPAGRA